MASSKKKSETSLHAVSGVGVSRLAEASQLRKQLARLNDTIAKKTDERQELLAQLNSLQDMCKHNWSLPMETADRTRVKVVCSLCGMEKIVPRDSIKVTGL